GKTYASGRRDAIDRDLGVSFASTREASGEEAFHFTRPILYAGKEVGQVEVGVRKNELLEAAGFTRMLLIALGVIMMAVVIGLSLMAGRLVLAPVRRLNAALKDAANGNLDFRITHGRCDEFGDLFDNFNRLAANLQQETASVAPPTPKPVATANTFPASLVATVLSA
ncbi:MAG: HAMP domain-containing protein, partial [Burkholderiales bacterium]